MAMNKQEFIISLHLWLGIAIFPSFPDAIRCTCGQMLGQFGDHLLSCGHGNLWTIRCDVIFHALLLDNSQTRHEQRCSGESNSRPGDTYHPDFSFGRPGYFDVSVQNPLLPSYVNKAALRSGVAAEAGERDKDSRHKDLVTASGGLFYLLVVECLGCWTPSSLEIIKTIARKTVISIGSSISRSVTNLQEQQLWQYVQCQAAFIETELVV